MLYKPREDSYLLAKYVKKHSFGRVLDIGTGSGIQAMTAAKLKKVKDVLAIDIQKSVIEHCKSTINAKKISFRQSNLFEDIEGRFDTITFNPPYLPEDVTLKDITVEGGKKGYETLERFFGEASGFLSPDGMILIVFSSLTKKEKVNEMIKNGLLEFKELEKQKLFFEELYVYEIKKSEMLKILEKRKITGIKKLAKGHRGLIFTGNLKNKKIAVKIQRKDIAAKGTVNIESKTLRLLNRYNIGPKLLFSGKDFFAYEFVEGIFIPAFVEKAQKKEIIKVLKSVFQQCYVLDRLEINKEEMQHPYKHVVVGKRGNRINAVLLDFERARKTKTGKAHNVTQFCQYVTSGKFRHLAKGKLRVDKKKVRKLAGIYKKDMSRGNFERILGIIR